MKIKHLIYLLALPIVLIFLFLISSFDAFNNHNEKVITALFYNLDTTNDLTDFNLNIYQDLFNQIDYKIERLENTDNNIDALFIKSFLLNLIIEKKDINTQSFNVDIFLNCFYNIEFDEDNNSNLITITDTKEIINNFNDNYNVSLDLNTTYSIYNIALLGSSPDNNISHLKLLEAHFIESEKNSLLNNTFKSPFIESFNPFVTSEFGKRSPVVLPDGSIIDDFHTGLDISKPLGESVYAVSDGKVVLVKYSNVGLGIYMVIDHGGGIFSVYGHLSKIHVRENDEVVISDHIADVGSTGFSTGPHLHLEIIENRVNINPRKYLK